MLTFLYMSYMLPSENKDITIIIIIIIIITHF